MRVKAWDDGVLDFFAAKTHIGGKAGAGIRFIGCTFGSRKNAALVFVGDADGYDYPCENSQGTYLQQENPGIP